MSNVSQFKWCYLASYFLNSAKFESAAYVKILQKVEIQDLRWTRETKSCKKIFKPFIDIKTRLENDPFDKASIKANFIKANTSRYVKRTFKKKKKKKKKNRRWNRVH